MGNFDIVAKHRRHVGSPWFFESVSICAMESQGIVVAHQQCEGVDVGLEKSYVGSIVIQ